MRSCIFALIFILFLELTICNQLETTLKCLNDYMESLKEQMSPKIFQIFKKSYPNTLQTTIQQFDLTPGNESTYIITGDIQAMWLRDSTNQFLPYIRIPKQCTHVRSLAKGLINTQAELIMIDPYTNAFKKFQKPQIQRHFYLNDKTTTLIFGLPVDLCRLKQFATKSIWQRKFQIDSLASFLRLAYEYQHKYSSIDFVNLRFIRALKRIMSVVDQQTKDMDYQRQNHRKFYTFYREPRQLQRGQIKPSFETGMIKTGFRPSDDPNSHAYNIPGNAMMCTYLELVAQEILDKIPFSSVLKREASLLSRKMKQTGKTIKQAIYNFGIVQKEGKKIFAYQVNGNGQSVVFDDANLPSLVSLSYLRFVTVDDQIYKNTREYMLSHKNPYYYQNDKFSGIGSSHTAERNIWPLALITQILTSSSNSEIMKCLQGLIAQARDNLIHQSFSIDNPQSNTRAWFAWANSLFGEAIIKLATQNPQVLK